MNNLGALHSLHNAIRGYASGGTVTPSPIDWLTRYNQNNPPNTGGHGNSPLSQAQQSPQQSAQDAQAASYNPATGQGIGSTLSNMVTPTAIANFGIGQLVSAALGPIGAAAYGGARLFGFNPAQGIAEQTGLSTPTRGYEGGYWGKQGVGDGISYQPNAAATTVTPSITGALSVLGDSGKSYPTVNPDNPDNGSGISGSLSIPQFAALLAGMPDLGAPASDYSSGITYSGGEDSSNPAGYSPGSAYGSTGYGGNQSQSESSSSE